MISWISKPTGFTRLYPSLSGALVHVAVGTFGPLLVAQHRCKGRGQTNLGVPSEAIYDIIMASLRMQRDSATDVLLLFIISLGIAVERRYFQLQ